MNWFTRWFRKPEPSGWVFVQVTDGDTVEMKFLPLHENLQKFLIRIAGIDTPETSKAATQIEREKGLEAKRYLEKWFDDAKEINLAPQKWGKWGGRAIADIQIDGKDVGREMIKRGLAVPYQGGKKADWNTILLERENSNKRKPQAKKWWFF